MSKGTAPARARQVCPYCGSADLVEIAYGRRAFAVTYYTDGSFEDRSGDAWKVETWDNGCNACDAALRYDELVPESAP